LAWILIHAGNAADYDSGDVVMDKQEDPEYKENEVN